MLTKPIRNTLRDTAHSQTDIAWLVKGKAIDDVKAMGKRLFRIKK